MDEETDVASGVELQTEKRKKKTDRIDPSEKESRCSDSFERDSTMNGETRI